MEYTSETIYRFHRYSRKGEAPKKYKCTLEVLDHHTEKVLAVCDVIEPPLFKLQTVVDENNQKWHLKSNRKIMPSRWLLTDSENKLIIQFDQQISRKMLTPFTKILFTLHNEEGKELYRFVDPESNLIDQLMGCSPGEWALLSEKTLVAKMVRIPREKVEQKGIRGWIKRLKTGSDSCLVCLDGGHILPAPAALCLYVLYEELSTNTAA